MMATRTPWQARVQSIPTPPLQLPGLIWQLLYSRGVQSAVAVQNRLKASLKELRSPLSLKGMDVAVDRLIQAHERQEAVCIYADFDLDGSSGLALLKTGLEKLGFQNVIGYQPRRLAEGYGVHIPAVREISAMGVKLMVTVDVGITALAALKEAKAIGLDVIVTDHHLPCETLPEALTIVNPNQGTCTSNLGHLAGVGVAFYLLLAVRSRLRDMGRTPNDFDPKELLDFFVIGTLTDMVPLTGENRVLVKHGLVQLAHTQRAGLRALLEALELTGRELSSQDVAIKLAPKLNALSRLESPIRPIDMLLAPDLNEARRLAREVLACNERRIETQKRGLELALEKLKEAKPKHCVWVWSKEFHRGVVGLIATRLSQELGLPAFVGSLGEDGRIVGSARMPKAASTNLVNALSAANSALGRFGGHAAAAGFELGEDQAGSLGELLTAHFASGPKADADPIWYDGEGDLAEINEDLMTWVDNLGPYGSGFESPVFRLRDAKIKKFSELRGGHLRFELVGANSLKPCAGIYFSPPQEIVDSLRQGAADPVEILGELQWNHYQGRRTLQLQVRDLRLKN
jgi:single-stranded-DNA-specific exonuclease